MGIRVAGGEPMTGYELAIFAASVAPILLGVLIAVWC